MVCITETRIKYRQDGLQSDEKQAEPAVEPETAGDISGQTCDHFI